MLFMVLVLLVVSSHLSFLLFLLLLLLFDDADFLDLFEDPFDSLLESLDPLDLLLFWLFLLFVLAVLFLPCGGGLLLCVLAGTLLFTMLWAGLLGSLPGLITVFLYLMWCPPPSWKSSVVSVSLSLVTAGILQLSGIMMQSLRSSATMSSMLSWLL